MTHRYYDFYMRFDSDENALKAQNFFNEKHRPAIGGKFVINDNGVCSLSVRDECKVITDLYGFGMSRFIVVDDSHGFRRENGQEFFDFCTDSDKEYTYINNEGLFEAINSFLKEEILKDGFIHEEGVLPPIIKRYDESMGIDDVYDMLDVNVPGFDY